MSSIRIYALAKQLKVESKDLVEFCKKLGIEGKASALASLTEEEADKVKAALQEEARTSQTVTSTVVAPVPFQRPAVVPQTGKIPVLKQSAAAGKTQRPKSEETAPNAEEHPEESKLDAVEYQETEVKSDSDLSDAPDTKETSAVDTDFQPTTAEIGGQAEPIEPESPSQTPVDPNLRTKPDENAEKKVVALTPEKETRKPPITMPLSKKLSPLTKTTPLARRPVVVPPPPPEPLVRPDLSRNIQDKSIPSLDQRRKTLNPVDAAKSSDASAVSTPPKQTETPTKPVGHKPSGPTIRLAPLPKQATKPVKSANEPAPQKPDLKLPKEAIRAAQMGTSRPLTEHIRKHEEKRQLAADGKRGIKGSPKKKGKDGEAFVADDVARKKEVKRVRGRDGKLLEVSPAEESRDSKKKTRSSSGGTRRFNEGEADESVFFPRHFRRLRKSGRSTNTAAPRKSDIVVQLPCSVKQYAEMTGLSVANVIRKLMEFGTPMMINSSIDKETAELLAVEFGLMVDIRDEISLEDRLVKSLFEEVDAEDSLQPRAPVVTFLGHVDHGKTSLLDRILHLNVVSGEKGGITQHIRAYRVPTEHGDVTFVDTPGHEAFTEMRARGANCTDIAVLVVAADDGVMPQTEEAISHAKAAGVPIVVALNKMDLHGANPDKAIQGLAANELIPSEWGGDVEIVRCSAITGMGMDDLMQTLLTVAELHELRANPNRPAIGVALEAELQAGMGVVCKVLVQNGTLRTGDVVLCGNAYGRVKAMYDTLDPKKQLDEAPPSTPVNLTGLDTAPTAGSKFCVLEDISEARQIAEARSVELRKVDLAEAQSHVTLENLFQRISQAGEVQTLNVIIRADVRGSIEAIKKELGKLEHPEVKIRILQATVGGVTEADVQLADASDAIIVGFNVVPDENARTLADKKKVQIRRYDIIYNLTNDIKSALEGMLKPMEQVKELGRALVQRVFSISRLGSIAGCRVLAGNIERNARMRIIRDSRIIGEYNLDSLKREKDDAKEVREGLECGIKLKGFNDLKEGDILEAFKIEEIARTF